MTPRDAFRRRLYLQPLGVMLTVDGGSVQSAEIRLRPGPPSAVVRVTPSPAGVSVRAFITLRADGEGAEGRRVTMRCEAPCGFEPSIFPAAADVFVMRFGASEGASFELTTSSSG